MSDHQPEPDENPIARICSPGGGVARLLWNVPRGVPPYPPFPAALRASNFTPDDPWKYTAVASPVADARLRDIFAPINAFPDVWVYLHGSQSDGTATPFSDWDDLVIVDADNYHTASRRRELIAALNRIDRRFCTLDPLQHHGHWIIPRKSILNYNAAWIPPAVLNGAISIQGPTTVSFIVDRTTSVTASESMLRCLQRNTWEMARRYFERRLNLYWLKSFIGSIALIPAVYYQSKGIMLSKPEAIERCCEDLDPVARSCLTWATEMRRNWASVFPNRRRLMLRSALAPVRNPFLHRRICSHIAPLPATNMSGPTPLGTREFSAFMEATN